MGNVTKVPVNCFEWCKEPSQFREGFIESYIEESDEECWCCCWWWRSWCSISLKVTWAS